MEEILTNHLSAKALIPKIYRELRLLNSKKRNSPIRRQEKNLSRHFSKRDTE